MDFDKIAEIALKEMQSEVTPSSPANISKLQESIAHAIAKAFEEYDKQKKH